MVLTMNLALEDAFGKPGPGQEEMEELVEGSHSPLGWEWHCLPTVSLSSFLYPFDFLWLCFSSCSSSLLTCDGVLSSSLGLNRACATEQSLDGVGSGFNLKERVFWLPTSERNGFVRRCRLVFDMLQYNTVLVDFHSRLCGGGVWLPWWLVWIPGWQVVSSSVPLSETWNTIVDH